MNIVLSCFKQLSLNSTVVYELRIHFTFGERLLSGAVGAFMLSPSNPLNFHPITVSVFESIINWLKC